MIRKKNVRRLLWWIVLLVSVTMLLTARALAQGPAAEEIPQLARWEVVYLVMTITQLVKVLAEPHLAGKRAIGLALVLGLVLFGIEAFAQAGYIGPEAMTAVNAVIRTIGYTVSIPGLYSLAKDEFLPAVAGLAK